VTVPGPLQTLKTGPFTGLSDGRLDGKAGCE
jgi:hypothetical protein